MMEEKKEQREIVVLDEGMDLDRLMDTDQVCCWAAFIPVWG